MRQDLWRAGCSAWNTASGAALLLALLPQVQSVPNLLENPRARCLELKDKLLQEGDVIITGATFVDALTLNVSGTLNAHPFCRVASQLAYGSDDTLNFEVWLPGDAGYNGRYLAVGMSLTKTEKEISA